MDNNLIASLEPFMFTPENMNAIALTQISTTCKENVELTKQTPKVALPTVALPTVAVPIVQVITPTFVVKDKLFLQFYTLLNGLPMVLAQKANWFYIEKQFKIATVEQLLSKHDKEYKVVLKAQKLKVAECEDNLVTAAQIGLPGLYALCLVHNVSLLFVQDRKYMHMGKNDPTAILKANKDLSSVELLEGVDVDDAVTDIYANYWEMESIHKLLRSPSAYTLAELQEIVRRLAPEIGVGTMKKSALYSLILEKI